MKMKTTYRNVWNAQTVLRNKCIGLNAHIRKEERSKINNLNFYLREVKKGKSNPKQADENK